MNQPGFSSPEALVSVYRLPGRGTDKKRVKPCGQPKENPLRVEWSAWLPWEDVNTLGKNRPGLRGRQGVGLQVLKGL